MAYIMTVCIEMENSVIDTVIHDCRNIVLINDESDLFIQFQEQVSLILPFKRNDVIEKNSKTNRSVEENFKIFLRFTV